jgi:4-alpha-glucanotransferase
LWISDNGELGADLIKDAIPMTYLNDEFWIANIKIERDRAASFHYKYILKNPDGEIIPEHGSDRFLEIKKKGPKEYLLIDTWNHAGEYENVFYTAPFEKILLKKNEQKGKTKSEKDYTHIFRVKAPLLKKNETICLTGGAVNMGGWSEKKVIVFSREGNWWTAKLDLSGNNFPVAYKYGIYNTAEKKFVQYEGGNNRLLHGDSAGKRLTILHDGFAHFPNNTWKGAGVAIPVFSLRSKKSFGVGEFNDLKLLVDWAKTAGLKLIQILPVNDTIATRTWADSYPYAAISAFALHPVYINIEKTAGKKNTELLKPLAKKQKELNALANVDYNEVVQYKLKALKEIYDKSGNKDLETKEYAVFFAANEHWLIPYAAFCYLRDKYGTSDFNQWKTNSVYTKPEIEKLSAGSAAIRKEISFHYFVQYHLHLQLKEAADYAHKKGVVLKGDIPIGIYRYGCDAWMDPELYQMNWQAGAPPDDFSVKGQNWGFPTYNWKKMQEDHFEWWRKRFEQMSNYFDAFRIDHILGFFRIWSIPSHAVEGIMGRFVPAIPVSITEFGERGIWFDHHRYCRPYITNDVLNELFGKKAEQVKKEFLNANDFGTYDLKPEFDTQRKVEKYFAAPETNEENENLKTGLYNIISNIILFEEKSPQGPVYHFRIGMEHTISFKQLDWHLQQKLKELYVNYFFRRQDNFWMKEAMHKLPYMKRATNMLVCGEDLGMVPHCVPEVMAQLGILSLEIQRMPKRPEAEFFHPNDAPYLSVVTPSTHDMRTIRGWWEEDKIKIAAFYNRVMGQWGDAPYYCEPWINRAIVLQHLYSPAMWSIFQLQDILGMSEKLRRDNPHEERINVPANPNNHWKYRMHLLLEELIKQKKFNEELKGYVVHSGRA